MAALQLIVLLLISIGLYAFRRLYVQHKNRNDAIGHIWATFYTAIGTSYSATCPVHNNIVTAPSAAQEVLRKVTGNKEAHYFVRQDKTFDIAYPPGKPSWAQTRIPHTIFYEGNPEPQISRNPATRLEAIGTSEFMDNLSNEKMTSLMVRYSDDMEELREAAKNKISAKTVYLLLVVCVLVVCIDLMFDFNTLDAVGKILTYWGV